jgi:HEAT repeat protein
MKFRLLFAIALFWPTTTPAQVNGKFFFRKEAFAPREPVFLYFETTNTGTEAQDLARLDSYSACSTYQIRVSSDPDPKLSWELSAYAGSCFSFLLGLAPGESRTQRVILNYGHNIDGAGVYGVDVVAQLPSDTENFIELRQHLQFRVDKSAEPDPEVIPDLLAQLKSYDWAVREEAAVALTSAAPPSLEDLFLSFAGDSEFRRWAPLAFYKLNTPSSLEAMANLLRASEPGSEESLRSARFLAKTRDPKWYPLLLEFAQKHSNIADYVSYAAESGGDAMLPELNKMMSSSDHESTQANAISALAYTGSRAAVPILIELLRDPAPEISERALIGLGELSHRTVGTELWHDDAQSQYAAWARWWEREGASASIYKPDEFGEGRPLN